MKRLIIAMIIFVVIVTAFYHFASNAFYITMSRIAEGIRSLAGGKGDISIQKIDCKNANQKPDIDTSNHIFVTFKNIDGLRSGDKVRYIGENVGVSQIMNFNSAQNERYKVLIKFRNKDFRVKNNSKFYINTLGLANNKYIEIVAPEQEQGFLENGCFVKGEETETVSKNLPSIN